MYYPSPSLQSKGSNNHCFENLLKPGFFGVAKIFQKRSVSVGASRINVWQTIFKNIRGEKSANKKYIYLWFIYQQIFSEELKRCLIPKMPQLNCLLTTINFFENKTIEEDKKCQHIFKHTVVRNRFLCVINSTIYLRGIYRKIFFNLAEFLVGFWPLMLTLQSMQEGQ